MKVEVYTFVDKNDQPVTDWTTQDAREAKEYGQQNGCRVIANIFEVADSELVWDFTELR